MSRHIRPQQLQPSAPPRCRSHFVTTAIELAWSCRTLPSRLPVLAPRRVSISNPSPPARSPDMKRLPRCRHSRRWIGKEVVPEASARSSRRPGSMACARARLVRIRQCRILREARPHDAGGLEERIGGHDAIFFGAVAGPRRFPIMSRCGARWCCSGASSTSTSTCGRCG